MAEASCDSRVNLPVLLCEASKFMESNSTIGYGLLLSKLR